MRTDVCETYKVQYTNVLVCVCILEAKRPNGYRTSERISEPPTNLPERGRLGRSRAREVDRAYERSPSHLPCVFLVQAGRDPRRSVGDEDGAEPRRRDDQRTAHRTRWDVKFSDETGISL